MSIKSFSLFVLICCSTFLNATPITPENGAHLNHIHVLFEWEQIPETNSYELQISENSNFSNSVLWMENTTLIHIEKDVLDWDKTYFWRIRPIFDTGSTGAWSNSFSFSTASPLSETTTVISDANQIQEGITVFGAFFNYFSAAVDETGKEIWNSGDENLVYYSTNKYGNVFGCNLVSGTENNLPGKEFTFDGNTIWEEPNDEFLHHDLIKLPNGNYLGIVEAHSLGPIPIGEWTHLFQGLGFQADGVTIEFPWVGDKLVEWEAETGNVVWEWSVFDHFSMLDYDQFGGTWNQAYVDLHYDWTHVNAVIFEESENALYISTRHLSRITKIDYPSGNVVWNLGHDMPSGQVTLGHDLGFSFQHSVQILENGNILTFDNGNLSEIFRGTDGPQSRVIEIAVNDNNAELVWSYELSDDLFGFASGNAQKLENGNVLVTTVGGGGRSLEVNIDGDLIWEANYNLSIPNGAVYRAHRIPSLFPAAYSVIINNLYNFGENVGVNLHHNSSSISFDIVNEGDYNLEFHYTFTDQLGWFNHTEGTFSVLSNSTETISFSGDNFEENELNNIEFIVTPIHHPERQKFIQVNGFSQNLDITETSFKSQSNLNDPYPNPFNAEVQFSFDNNRQNVPVEIRIFDVSGRLVESRFLDQVSMGLSTFSWDAKAHTSGVYFIRLMQENQTWTKKIILMK